jgi:uncharacterized protein (DUF4415 family)
MSAISKPGDRPAMSRHDGDLAARRRAALEVARESLDRMTHEEDRDITANALSDPDNPPLDEAFFARKGRPPLENPKQAVKLRLDADLLAALRASGAGWQTRANAMLRKAMGLE